MKAPIICGREPTATEDEKKLGAERATELSAQVNQVFFLGGSSLLAYKTYIAMSKRGSNYQSRHI